MTLMIIAVHSRPDSLFVHSVHILIGLILVALRPKRLLEQIKGISEQKATKILVEGEPSSASNYNP